MRKKHPWPCCRLWICWHSECYCCSTGIARGKMCWSRRSASTFCTHRHLRPPRWSCLLTLLGLSKQVPCSIWLMLTDAQDVQSTSADMQVHDRDCTLR